MSQFIESLKRLYLSGKVTEEKLFDLFRSKKISDEEIRYITDAR